MALAATIFTWADFESALKAYLEVLDTSEDAQLQPFLEAAAQDLDDYAGWYYTDADDTQIDTTPTLTEWGTLADGKPMLRLGVYEWVKAARAMFSSPASEGARGVRTGALSETYAGRGDTVLSLAALARSAALPLWSASVYNLLKTSKVA